MSRGREDNPIYDVYIALYISTLYFFCQNKSFKSEKDENVLTTGIANVDRALFVCVIGIKLHFFTFYLKCIYHSKG